VVGLLILLVLVGGTLAIRVFLNGERLAKLVQQQLNQRIRGRVEVESIEWALSDLPAILRGGPLPLTITKARVFDADKREIINVPHLTATLDTGAAMFGRHDLYFSNIKIPRGQARIIQIREPHPMHEWDLHTISLADAFAGKAPERFQAGLSARPQMVIDLDSYELENVDLVFEFPDAGWSAVVTGARTPPGKPGSLTFDGRDPLADKLFYSLSPEAESATVTVRRDDQAPIVVPLHSIEVGRLRQLPFGWPDESIPRALEYVAIAHSGDGAYLAIDGKLFHSFTDVFGGEHDLTVRAEKFGPMLRILSDGVAGGDDLALSFRVEGPGLAPALHAQLSGLEVDLPVAADRPPLELGLARLSASWNTATGTGSIEDTVATGGGGEVRLSATFNQKPTTGDLHLDVTRPIDLGPYLPPKLVHAVGGQLSGRIHAFGTADTQRIDQLDLTLGRARVTGALYRSKAGLIHPDGLEIAMGGTAARKITGVLDGKTGDLSIDLLLRSSDLARWLRAFGQPALARTLNGRIHIGGNKDDLKARATLTAGGVPFVDRLDARVSYQGGTVQVHEAESSALGGWLRGSGKLLLNGRPRLADVEAQGVNLDLSKIPGAGALLRGQVDVEAKADGPTSAPRGEAVARIQGLEIAGEAYDDTEIRATAAVGDTVAVKASFARKKGGELSLDARYDLDSRELGGVLDLRKLPVEAIAALLGAPGVVGGRLDAALTLSGTPAAPTADGTIEITRGWFKQAFIGTAGITVERVAEGQLRVSGSMFQGRIEIDGVVATEAPFAAELALRMRRVELDLFAPELASKHGLRGWVSGEIGFRGDLSLARPGKLRVEATLTEAVVVLDGDDGRPGGLRISNKTPLELVYDGDRLALRREAVLSGPTGDIRISGWASPEALALRGRGKIAVGLLAPYVKEYFDRVAGELVFELVLSGSPDEPRLAGVAEVVEIAMQPAGQDTIVRIPGGKLELDGDQVSLTGLSMVVTDEFSAEQSELRLAGGLRLDRRLRPEMWAVRIDGQLDGKMLLVLAPQVFSSGYGSADLSIALLGAGEMPDIDGTVEFSPETPLTFVPRGARREIALTKGFLKFTDQLIELGEIGGTVDDEGVIERLEGELGLEDWRPVDVDVSLDASSLPLRIPQELELSVNLRKVRFVGSAEGLDIGGTIEIPDGRYIRKFNVFSDVLKPERASTPSKPFWEENAVIGRARLDLTVLTQAFYVRNNLGTIAMSGQVSIGGTPRAPRLDGVIRIDDGDVKLPIIRPRFERASGTVSFTPMQQFPEGTPRLDLRAEADYTDASGQAHLIHLTFKGTLTNLDWDLRTESGLNRTQTLQLVLAGRTPDEVRAALGDAAIGKPGAVADQTGSDRSGLVYADQFVKDLSGDFFGLLLGDSLRDISGLDVVRLQLGTSAIGVHGEKKITPSLGVSGNYENSLRGWSWDLTGEYRLSDSISFEGKHVQREFDDEALEDVNQTTFQGTWRWVLLP
jgi:hypothetical protein